MTAKIVEDLFLIDDLRAGGDIDLADALAVAETHEEVLLLSLVWLLAAGNEEQP
jgi:hypothetical protein